MIDRAAQFSPFSALVGYEDAIAESGRLTQQGMELDQDAREILDRQLRYLHDHPGQTVSVTYFLPDERKAGGAYVQTVGIAVKVDPLEQILVMETETIPMGTISALQILGQTV